MPPVTILSPYSGRPVKIREHDLGRALRDEQGRVFYVVEDPEHGRYAARTRKGSEKDLQRYREIESGVAKLEDGPELEDARAQHVHDATGSKRRNPMGLLAAIVILSVIAAAGYIYLNHPDWLGIESTASEADEAEDTQEIDAGDAEQSSRESTQPKIQGVFQKSNLELILDARTLGPAAAPRTPIEQATVTSHPTRPPLPDDLDTDPEPIVVAARTPAPQVPKHTQYPAIQPMTPLAKEVGGVPIVLAAMQAAPASYDDFHHTASGLRYKITHLSDGVSARAGNYLTIRYTAQTLGGKPLINDASQSFTLARGQAIRALDEGLAGIREGEQLRMLVPRGHSDQGTLPGIDRLPNEPFLLDVQLVSVRPGVTFITESPGDTDRLACTPGDTIDLHYIARVEGRDEVIDATVHRGQPMRLTLGNNEVIKGLELGITGMRPGESRQLTIPSYLAYGKHSVAGGLIPENAVLSFRVTLVQVVEEEEARADGT